MDLVRRLRQGRARVPPALRADQAGPRKGKEVDLGSTRAPVASTGPVPAGSLQRDRQPQGAARPGGGSVEPADVGFRYGPAAAGGQGRDLVAARWPSSRVTLVWNARRKQYLVTTDGRPEIGPRVVQYGAGTVVVQYVVTHKSGNPTSTANPPRSSTWSAPARPSSCATGSPGRAAGRARASPPRPPSRSARSRSPSTPRPGLGPPGHGRAERQGQLRDGWTRFDGPRRRPRGIPTAHGEIGPIGPRGLTRGATRSRQG